MRDKRKSPKREGISRYFRRSVGIPLLLSSFYPGTKLLFWRRLFEIWKPVVTTMMRKSSRLFCVRVHFLLIFYPHSKGLYSCLAPFQHLVFCRGSLKSLCVSSFYLLQFFFSVPLVTFNWNILQHLPFMSCLLASLGLSSLFSFRPSHLLRSLLILSIFFLLFHWTAVLFPPTVWLFPRLLLPPYLFPISLLKTSG